MNLKPSYITSHRQLADAPMSRCELMTVISHHVGSDRQIANAPINCSGGEGDAAPSASGEGVSPQTQFAPQAAAELPATVPVAVPTVGIPGLRESDQHGTFTAAAEKSEEATLAVKLPHRLSGCGLCPLSPHW